MSTEMQLTHGVLDELGNSICKCSHNYLWLHNFNYIGGAMSLWWLPIIVGLGGAVTLLMIIILHLIEEYRHDRF